MAAGLDWSAFYGTPGPGGGGRRSTLDSRYSPSGLLSAEVNHVIGPCTTAAFAQGFVEPLLQQRPWIMPRALWRAMQFVLRSMVAQLKTAPNAYS